MHRCFFCLSSQKKLWCLIYDISFFFLNNLIMICVIQNETSTWNRIKFLYILLQGSNWWSIEKRQCCQTCCWQSIKWKSTCVSTRVGIHVFIEISWKNIFEKKKPPDILHKESLIRRMTFFLVVKFQSRTETPVHEIWDT